MVTETHNSGIRRICDGEKTRRLTSCCSPLIARDIEVRTQRPPHTARLHPVLDGLRGGTAVKSTEHVVDDQRTTPHRAELAVYELIEFRQPHRPNLPSISQGVMAHPYRICHLGRRGAGALRGRTVGGGPEHRADRRGQRIPGQWPHQLRTTLAHNAIG